MSAAPSLHVQERPQVSSIPPEADRNGPEPAEHLRRPSLALSISSLSDETSKVATEACQDVERELAAIETRLNLYRDRRKRNNDQVDITSKTEDTSGQLQKTEDNTGDTAASAVLSSSMSSRSADSPTYDNLSKARQQATQVADEVATTLFKCDQLLQRVQSYSHGSSRASSISSRRERSGRVKDQLSPPFRHSTSVLSESMASSVSPSSWEVATAIEEEEAQLTQKAAAVKRFAARCQRDIETNTAAIRAHHKQTQASYLKELQRKYDSKKHMTLMALREKYEKETKALVRAKVEEYEVEEAAAVKRARSTLLEERARAFQDLQSIHESTMEEHLAQLEMHLTQETERKKIELNNQLQEELRQKLKKMQDDSQESLERWETELRQELEQQLLAHREAAVASLLKTQEEQTATIKREIQASHQEKEEAELQKLKKALAFGAQAQLQQLRKQLEMEHDEKVHQTKTEASLSLEKSTAELREMLTRSHREQEQQLERDLEKKNRVAVMELHDSMQTSHQGDLQALKDAAEQRRADALDEYRKEFELECHEELRSLEKTLEQETTAKLQRLEIDHADECEHKLEQLRTRAMNQHSRELEAKTSRMIQCKNVLLAEASAFLSFESAHYSSCDKSDGNPEDNAAASHLRQLKKHLSKELAQYVDVMVAEFDEIAEEQRILVSKIAESTQLYLTYKRRCGVLEGQSEELESGLETLHDQLQQKDAICKKLYQANEALLKRLQTPALEASVATSESNPSSPPLCHSPALAKALTSASPWHNRDS